MTKRKEPHTPEVYLVRKHNNLASDFSGQLVRLVRDDQVEGNMASHVGSGTVWFETVKAHPRGMRHYWTAHGHIETGVFDLHLDAHGEPT